MMSQRNQVVETTPGQLTEVWHIAHFWMFNGRCPTSGLPMGWSEGLSW